MAERRVPEWSPGTSEEATKPNRSVPEESVRAELGKILESHEFRSSKRCQDFLRFVVENTLGGRTDILKERTIGIEAFGRRPSYDPSDDATVRVKAGEVRKRLGLYYAGDGRTDEVKIDLPPGGYIPDFAWLQPAVLELDPASETAPANGRKSVTFERRVTFALLGILLIGIFAWIRLRHTSTVLDEFWAPVLAGSSPALLCAAYVPVYTDRELGRDHPQTFNDFILLNDQFVGGGDLVAATHLAGMLTKMGRAYQVRIGNEVSFQDLRAAPAVLIGYSYTRWKEISNELRYFIDASRRPVVVTDNGTPTRWFLSSLGQDRHTDEDYAIVSRVFHPDTRAMMVEISGITQYGTEAAADLVTNSGLLSEALRDAPPDWGKKNLQLVLHVKVISGTPASALVVAKYFW